VAVLAGPATPLRVALPPGSGAGVTEDERMIASSACDVVRLNLTRPEDDQRR
jgi:hypothetical protein